MGLNECVQLGKRIGLTSVDGFPHHNSCICISLYMLSIMDVRLANILLLYGIWSTSQDRTRLRQSIKSFAVSAHAATSPADNCIKDCGSYHCVIKDP